MSSNDYPIIRLWDGKQKQATVWGSFTTDSELFAPDANCFVYMTRHSLLDQTPALAIRLDQLVSTACQPLVAKLLHQGVSHPLNTSDPDLLSPHNQDMSKATTSLRLEPPEHFSASEVTQYNITTRNFFAWMMGKPVVGPDPATALLALKVRMDLWRATSTDNLTSLFLYAREQGYGDLGDIQLLLQRRMRGLEAPPTQYTLLPEDSAGTKRRLAEQGSSPTNFLKKQKLPPWMHFKEYSHFVHGKFSRSSTSLDLRSFVDEPPGGRQQPDVTDLESSTSALRRIRPRRASIELGSVSCLPSFVQTTHSQSSCDPERPTTSYGEATQQPTTAPDIIPAVNMPVEVISEQVWMRNLSEEHHQMSLTHRHSKSDSSVVTMPRSTEKLQRRATVTSRRGRMMNGSRPPSPIREEGPPERVTGSDSSLEADQWQAQQEKTTKPDAISTSQTSLHAQEAGDAHTARKTCRSCSKPKMPEHIRNDLKRQSRPVAVRSTTEPNFRLLSDMTNWSQAALSGIQPSAESNKIAWPTEAERALATRFPSLRRHRRASDAAHHLEPKAAASRGKAANRLSLPAALTDSSLDQAIHNLSLPANASNPNLGAWTDRQRYAIPGGVAAASSPDTPAERRAHSAVRAHAQPDDTMQEVDSLMSGAIAVQDEVKQPESPDSYSFTSTVHSRGSLKICTTDLPLSNEADRDACTYRTPLREQPLEFSDTRMMDSILTDLTAAMATQSDKRASLYSYCPSITPTSDDSRWSSYISIETTSPPRNDRSCKPAESIASAGTSRWRSGVRSWNSKRSQKHTAKKESVYSLTSSIMVLDRSGSYVTLPTPRDTIDEPRDNHFDRPKTPLCELGT